CDRRVARLELFEPVDVAPKLGIMGAIHLAHAARAEWRDDFVRAQTRSGAQRRHGLGCLLMKRGSSRIGHPNAAAAFGTPAARSPRPQALIPPAPRLERI